MRKLQFDKCSCSFDIDTNKRVDFDTNLDNINLECKATWEMISQGNTKGCFQLESRLGQMMAKKLKPENIEQLAALISIMRPGCLEAIRDGKSVSNHFIDKKNNEEEIDYFHSCLEPVLKNTYGEMVYQEQAMEICQVVADFDLSEADMLRKAIGKKKPEEMAKIKLLFMEKSKSKNLISEDQAEELFSWIEKSQRYSFNKSHAVSYALNGYLSAYAKAHFTEKFFASYLKFAKDKIDPLKEIQELVNNANEMNVEVRKPDLRKLNKEFILDTDNKIYFGLTNIKGVGDSVFTKIINLIETSGIDVNNIEYLDLLFFLDKINTTAAKAIISVGAVEYVGVSRNKMLFDYDIIQNLTNKEKTTASSCSNKKDIEQALAHVLQGKILKKRADVIRSALISIKNPPYSLEDTYEWIANTEKYYLGASITCQKIDGCDLELANCECKDLLKSSYQKNIVLGAEILEINVIKTKKGISPGKEMAFLKVADGTGSVDLVAFPEEYSSYNQLLSIDNTIMFKIEPSKKRDSFIIKKCWQI